MVSPRSRTPNSPKLVPGSVSSPKTCGQPACGVRLYRSAVRDGQAPGPTIISGFGVSEREPYPTEPKTMPSAAATLNCESFALT